MFAGSSAPGARSATGAAPQSSASGDVRVDRIPRRPSTSSLRASVEDAADAPQQERLGPRYEAPAQHARTATAPSPTHTAREAPSVAPQPGAAILAPACTSSPFPPPTNSSHLIFGALTCIDWIQHANFRDWHSAVISRQRLMDGANQQTSRSTVADGGTAGREPHPPPLSSSRDADDAVAVAAALKKSKDITETYLQGPFETACRAIAKEPAYASGFVVKVAHPIGLGDFHKPGSWKGCRLFRLYIEDKEREVRLRLSETSSRSETRQGGGAGVAAGAADPSPPIIASFVGDEATTHLVLDRPTVAPSHLASTARPSSFDPSLLNVSEHSAHGTSDASPTASRALGVAKPDSVTYWTDAQGHFHAVLTIELKFAIDAGVRVHRAGFGQTSSYLLSGFELCGTRLGLLAIGLYFQRMVILPNEEGIETMYIEVPDQHPNVGKELLDENRLLPWDPWGFQHMPNVIPARELTPEDAKPSTATGRLHQFLLIGPQIADLLFRIGSCEKDILLQQEQRVASQLRLDSFAGLAGAAMQGQVSEALYLASARHTATFGISVKNGLKRKAEAVSSASGAKLQRRRDDSAGGPSSSDTDPERSPDDTPPSAPPDDGLQKGHPENGPSSTLGSQLSAQGNDAAGTDTVAQASSRSDALDGNSSLPFPTSSGRPSPPRAAGPGERNRTDSSNTTWSAAASAQTCVESNHSGTTYVDSVSSSDNRHETDDRSKSFVRACLDERTQQPSCGTPGRAVAAAHDVADADDHISASESRPSDGMLRGLIIDPETPDPEVDSDALWKHSSMKMICITAADMDVKVNREVPDHYGEVYKIGRALGSSHHYLAA